LESTHLYALELETQRVWDYAEDCYVHRLLRNTEDGKLVELGMPSDSAPLITSSSKENEASHGDFATLLAAQLESQRNYFETLLKKLEKTHDSEICHLLGQIESLSLEKKTLARESENASIMKKDVKTVEKKLEKMTKKIQDLEKELAEERAVSSSLLSDHNTYRSMLDKKEKEVEEKKAEINELKEQVRDLMFYLQTLNQSSQDSELAGASVITDHR
jgi:BRCA1-associated protein